MQDSGTITEILKRARQGEVDARDRLFSKVYVELRQRAGAQMRRERQNHTLEPTALVHEAYVRLVGSENLAADDRTQFFVVAARSMRQVLVDHARARAAAKRGGGRKRVPLSTGVLKSDSSEIDLVELNEALIKLADYGERLSQVVEMKFFAGMSVAEIAAALDVDTRTVKRDWRTARAILFDLLQGGGSEAHGAPESRK